MAEPNSGWTGRCHGNLHVIVDSEHRALRPIGMGAYEAAARTGGLLAGVAVPGLRIFQGVRAGPGEPPVGHVLSAGRRLLLIESVAWPPGRYVAGGDGRIHADGHYTGQSVTQLLAAIAHWRAALPRYRVGALVVVHPAGGGGVLPTATPDLRWVGAGEAAARVRSQLAGRGRAAGRRAVTALAAATGPPG